MIPPVGPFIKLVLALGIVHCVDLLGSNDEGCTVPGVFLFLFFADPGKM
jgi:hypothetical protein